MFRARPALLHVLIATGLTGAAITPLAISAVADPGPAAAAPAVTRTVSTESAAPAAASLLVLDAQAERTRPLSMSFMAFQSQIADAATARDQAVQAQAAAQAAADTAARAAEADRASRSRRVVPAPAAAPAPVVATGDPRSIARAMLAARGWGSQFSCLDQLWMKESGWSASAANRSSGAFGIPQSLPGSKMASAGADWRTNPATQITWGLNYIAASYGSPCGAWSHSVSHNWY